MWLQRPVYRGFKGEGKCEGKWFTLTLPSHPHPSDRKHAACRGFYGWASDSIGRARIKQLFTGSTAMLDLWHQNALLLLYLRRLCTFKDVAIKGKLYSSEFNQSFETKRSICAIKENENGKFDFNIDGVPHVSWFRKRWANLEKLLEYRSQGKIGV